VQVETAASAPLVLRYANGHQLELPPGISAAWLVVAPVDMRKGADGLSAIVQQALGHPPCACSAFVFRNRAGNRLKLLLWNSNSVWLLLWNSNSVWLCQCHLHRGGFVWPTVGDTALQVTEEQWH